MGVVLDTAFGETGVFGARSKLKPRPPGCWGGGEEILWGASRLDALCLPEAVLSTPCGRGGMGGAFAVFGLAVPSLPGDGERNERSVSDGLLSKPGLGLAVPAELPDPRLSRRLVWTLATSVRGCGFLVKAAAAAAADSDGLDFWKARVAAEEAAAET